MEILNVKIINFTSEDVTKLKAAQDVLNKLPLNDWECSGAEGLANRIHQAWLTLDLLISKTPFEYSGEAILK